MTFEQHKAEQIAILEKEIKAQQGFGYGILSVLAGHSFVGGGGGNKPSTDAEVIAMAKIFTDWAIEANKKTGETQILNKARLIITVPYALKALDKNTTNSASTIASAKKIINDAQETTYKTAPKVLKEEIKQSIVAEKEAAGIESDTFLGIAKPTAYYVYGGLGGLLLLLIILYFYFRKK